MASIHLPIRQLVEFLLRTGSIDSRFAGFDRANEGARIHRKLQKAAGEGYQAEVFLSAEREACGIAFTLEGRADGIFTDENGTVTGTVDIAYDINFRTVRFETNEQINAFGGENGVMNTLKRENMNMLMIGTVKNDLLGALESAVQNTDGSFKVYNVASGSAYTIFMLAEERFWGFTDVAPISVGNGIEAYTINVMW